MRSSAQKRTRRGRRGGTRPGKSDARDGSCPPSPPARLWAPWRMAFIESTKPVGCIFCDFPSQEGDENDRRNLLVHRGARSFTVLNRFPYNSGHVMVIPYAHVAQLDLLPEEEWADLHDELRRATRAVRAAYRPEGMNVGMNLGRIAGAGIADHLHYHVVPRWAGDTNYMPVLADTRVMVEHLDATWQKIREGFHKS